MYQAIDQLLPIVVVINIFFPSFSSPESETIQVR